LKQGSGAAARRGGGGIGGSNRFVFAVDALGIVVSFAGGR
jgi:hypothetical protein